MSDRRNRRRDSGSEEENTTSARRRGEGSRSDPRPEPSRSGRNTNDRETDNGRYSSMGKGKSIKEYLEKVASDTHENMAVEITTCVLSIINKKLPTKMDAFEVNDILDEMSISSHVPSITHSGSGAMSTTGVTAGAKAKNGEIDKEKYENLLNPGFNDQWKSDGCQRCVLSGKNPYTFCTGGTVQGKKVCANCLAKKTGKDVEDKFQNRHYTAVEHRSEMRKKRITFATGKLGYDAASYLAKGRNDVDRNERTSSNTRSSGNNKVKGATYRGGGNENKDLIWIEIGDMRGFVVNIKKERLVGVARHRDDDYEDPSRKDLELFKDNRHLFDGSGDDDARSNNRSDDRREAYVRQPNRMSSNKDDDVRSNRDEGRDRDEGRNRRRGDDEKVDTGRDRRRGDDEKVDTGRDRRRGDDEKVDTGRDRRRGDDEKVDTGRDRRRNDDEKVDTGRDRRRGDDAVDDKYTAPSATYSGRRDREESNRFERDDEVKDEGRRRRRNDDDNEVKNEVRDEVKEEGRRRRRNDDDNEVKNEVRDEVKDEGRRRRRNDDDNEVKEVKDDVKDDVKDEVRNEGRRRRRNDDDDDNEVKRDSNRRDRDNEVKDEVRDEGRRRRRNDDDNEVKEVKEEVRDRDEGRRRRRNDDDDEVNEVKDEVKDRRRGRNDDDSDDNYVPPVVPPKSAKDDSRDDSRSKSKKDRSQSHSDDDVDVKVGDNGFIKPNTKEPEGRTSNSVEG